MKIRFRFALIAVVIVMATNLQAQHVSGYVEAEGVVEAGNESTQLNVYLRGPLKGKLGWSMWAQTDHIWSEAYVGPTFTPAKWIECSVGLGLETDKNPLRIGTSVWLGKGKWSLLSINEHGGSGYWYKDIGKYQAAKSFALGVYSQRFVGVGPYAEKRFGKIGLWGAYLNDRGANNAAFGAGFNF